MPDQGRDALTSGDLCEALDRVSATIDQIRAELEKTPEGACG